MLLNIGWPFDDKAILRLPEIDGKAMKCND